MILKKLLMPVIAAISIGAIAIGLGGSAATAAPGDGPYQGGSYFVDNTLGQADMYGPLVDYLRAVPTASVYNSSLNMGIIAYGNLGADVKQQLAYGSVANGNIVNIPTKTIVNIGGTFSTKATKLGSFSLPAGTWNLFHKVKFERTVDGAAGTRMQLAIREGTSGEDYGTTMGTEISPTKGRELVQSGVAIVTVDGNTTLDAYGFGYDDNQSAEGSGEITGQVQIWAQRVG
jgi:hypothetical protein